MLRGIAVFRWGTWLWMAVVLTLHRDKLERPALAWFLIGVALAWTAIATMLLQRNPAAL